MATAHELRRLAQEARNDAAEVRRKAEEYAVTLDQQAADLEAMAEKASTSHVLTEVENPVKTSGNTMEDSLRVSISRGKRKKGDRLSALINKAGMSQSMLAEKIDVTPAALSRYISGSRKIPKAKAEAIAAATKGIVPVTAWRNLASDDA